MSRTKRSPAFQFYANDFLAGHVATYDLETIGAYTLLLAYDWNLNGLPLETERLAKLCRVSHRKFLVLWPSIADQFEERDGKLYNPRLAKEREKQELWRQKSSEGGKAGSEKRWHEGKGGDKGGLTLVKESSSKKDDTPSPSSVTTRSTDTKPPRRGGAETHAGENWVARLVEIWERSVGPIPHPRLGKVLQPLVARHGLDPVMAALERYIATTKTMGKNLNIQWFANEGEVWVERAKKPLIVDGWMSDELERATRPPGYNPRSA